MNRGEYVLQYGGSTEKEKKYGVEGGKRKEEKEKNKKKQEKGWMDVGRVTGTVRTRR